MAAISLQELDIVRTRCPLWAPPIPCRRRETLRQVEAGRLRSGLRAAGRSFCHAHYSCGSGTCRPLLTGRAERETRRPLRQGACRRSSCRNRASQGSVPAFSLGEASRIRQGCAPADRRCEGPTAAASDDGPAVSGRSEHGPPTGTGAGPTAFRSGTEQDMHGVWQEQGTSALRSAQQGIALGWVRR